MKRIGVGVAVLVAVVLLIASAIAQVIPDNNSVTGHLPGIQNEEQVWICPKDTSLILTNHRDFRLGYRQIGLGHGQLGGAFWIDTLIHPDFQIFERQSDPVMTVNSAGDIIICHLDYMDIPGYDSSHIVFMTSSDCGSSWNGPYTVLDTVGPYFEDKQFITSDRSGSIYDGNTYISWTRFSDGDPTRIMLARSTTNTVTWDDTLVVGHANYVTCGGFTLSAGQFSQPLVGKDGAVYVFWQGYDVDSSGGNCNFYDAIRFTKSTDGGVTWEGERMVGHVDGWSSVDGGVNVYSQPTTEADLSNGPYSGNLYLQYRDTESGPLHESDILFRRSLDTGQTWSSPMRVNDDPVGPDVDQFHNWLVCNEEGILASIWYDQRTDPSHFDFDVYAAYSYDGGVTWTSNHRISSVSISPSLLATSNNTRRAPLHPSEGLLPVGAASPQAGLIAEYIGLSMVHDKIVATWTDTRLGDQDVMSANWYLPVTIPRLIYPINGELQGSLSVTFDWATAWKEYDDIYRLQIATDAGFGVGTILVDVSSITDNTYTEDLAGVGFETLFWRVQASNGIGELTPFSDPGTFTLPTIECFCWWQGDINADGFIDAIDLSEVIDIVFFGGTDPHDGGCPATRADFNNDGFSDSVDLSLCIDHVFFGGAGPVDPCNP